MSQPSSGPGPAPAGGGSEAAVGPSVGSNLPEVPIDLQQLADKVYRLFLEDLRVQQGRVWNGRKGRL